jgi:hypothetical protein
VDAAGRPDHSSARDGQLRRFFHRIEVYQCRAFPKEDQDLDYVANSFRISGRNPTSEAEPWTTGRTRT